MRAPVPVSLALLLAVTLHAQSNGVVTTVAGQLAPGLRDGAAFEAQFDRPTWVDVDPSNGAIYVIDRENHSLRRIADGQVATLRVSSAWWEEPAPYGLDFGGPFGGGIAVEPASAGCGGNVYGHGIFISSSARHQLLLVTDLGSDAVYANRDSLPIIGFGEPGAVDGDSLIARFNSPGDVALSWNYGGSGSTFRTDALYVADTGNHAIRRIRYILSFEGCPQPVRVDTLAGGANFNAPRGVAAAPDGSVYVADTGNHTIRRIAPDGTVTTVAGESGVAGSNDGFAIDAHLNMPSGIDVNALGEVFIADTGNYTIRKLTLDGQLITIAGRAGAAGFVDGSARSARFSGIVGLRLVGDVLYLADTANNAIRKLDLSAPEPRRRAARH
jgi:DNA-binding beta-propeller fold protein YncE